MPPAEAAPTAARQHGGQDGVAAHYEIRGLARSFPVQLLTGLVCAAGAESEQAGVPLCWGLIARPALVNCGLGAQTVSSSRVRPHTAASIVLKP